METIKVKRWTEPLKLQSMFSVDRLWDIESYSYRSHALQPIGIQEPW